MMRKFLFVAVAVASGAAMAEGSDEALVEEKSSHAWHFKVGPVMSPRVRVKVSGNPNFALPLMPKTDSTRTGSSGSPDAYIDGFVHKDEGTGASFPETEVQGLTWNWGARNVPAQHAGDQMEFHTDMTLWEENISYSSYGGGSGSDSDQDLLVGVEAMGGWTFYDDETFDAAIDGGFRFYGSGNLKGEAKYGTSVTTTRDTYRFVDSYRTYEWNGGGPETMTYQGSAAGPGWLLYSTPDRRKELEGTQSRTETYYQAGSTKVNYRIWDLRLGPTVGWHVTDWFALRGGVYGLLGLVDATLKADANGYGASSSTCGTVFGMAFGLSAEVALAEDIFLYGGAEYDWWSDSVDLNAGGASAEIKLSDISVSLGLGIEF